MKVNFTSHSIKTAQDWRTQNPTQREINKIIKSQTNGKYVNKQWVIGKLTQRVKKVEVVIHLRETKNSLIFVSEKARI